ncbi:MAG: dTDP-glucose 4,6-dehydratase [Chlamydiales bacterium]|nr:dTDP-glucose 4,6-dehydratase [Chlamydiales bacterium]
MHLDLNNAHILVTGGAGFMGSAFIRFVLKQENFQGHVTNLDLLTYAGNLENLESVKDCVNYSFCQGDIQDEALLEQIQKERPIDAIVHFAAETHVDRSITGPDAFMQTNIMGTYHLLEFVRRHPEIHFHHISTDEVYGALGKEGVFTEASPYKPNSPYSASKAASDHLVRSYGVTYKISTTISHASNNYGPGQYPEKFIPLMIQNILNKKELPVYGAGENIREWLFVEDHARAIWTILFNGKKGGVYNIGGGSELKNIDLLHLLIEVVEEATGDKVDRDLITYVTDRPGHDYRYAMDGAKVEQLGYRPIWPLKAGLRETVRSIRRVCV